MPVQRPDEEPVAPDYRLKPGQLFPIRPPECPAMLPAAKEVHSFSKGFGFVSVCVVFRFELLNQLVLGIHGRSRFTDPDCHFYGSFRENEMLPGFVVFPFVKMSFNGAVESVGVTFANVKGLPADFVSDNVNSAFPL